MTPTLIGRWQTRLFVLATVGAIVTAIFGVLYDDFQTVFALLGYVLVFGLLWDIPYRVLQTYRWDNDWPPAYLFITGVFEGIFIWVFVKVWNTPPGVAAGITLPQFIAHYSMVWLALFIVIFSVLRTMFPRWRFQGGRFGGVITSILLVVLAGVVIGGVLAVV